MLMRHSDVFFASILDSMSQQIAVIDNQGIIRWVNEAWRTFAEENGGSPDKTWRDVNYLDVCNTSGNEGDPDAELVKAGIDKIINRELPVFFFEYPCHCPQEKRWFMMRIRPLEWDGPSHFLVTHQNITERKLAELRVEELAILDGLTGIANRRRFDDFLDRELRRAWRNEHPVSLALIDIDFFKPFNDHYGHMAGDECLRRVGDALKTFSRRPGDLVARYGGEEFAVIFGDTHNAAAVDLAEKIRKCIQELAIPHGFATEAGCVTISAGVATVAPTNEREANPGLIIEAADKALYQAKENGRNRVCYSAIR